MKNPKRLLIIGLGALLGAFAGWFYWKEVGCSSEGCIISGNPYVSTAYGALLLGLIAAETDKFTHKSKSIK
jgi:hypothetical protein